MKTMLALFLTILFLPVHPAAADGWTVEGFDGSTTKNSATLIWRTKVPTTGVLSLGLSPADFSYREVSATEPSTSHLVVVGNLPSATRFYFTVLATDQDGVNVASEIISKKTKAP
jgi:hypothetical protein